MGSNGANLSTRSDQLYSTLFHISWPSLREAFKTKECQKNWKRSISSWYIRVCSSVTSPSFPCFRPISLFIIVSVLQQYLIYVSTLPPLNFKVSTSHHLAKTPHPLQSVSSLAKAPPPKQADVILERSVIITWTEEHYKIRELWYLPLRQ